MGVTVVTLQALVSSANLGTSVSEARLECALCSQNMYQLPFSWHQVTKWITAVIGKSGFARLAVVCYLQLLGCFIRSSWKKRGGGPERDCDSVKTDLNTLEEKKLPKVTTAYKYMLCPFHRIFHPNEAAPWHIDTNQHSRQNRHQPNRYWAWRFHKTQRASQDFNMHKTTLQE